MNSLRATILAAFIGTPLFITFPAAADDADWEQVSIFANEAWYRGNNLAACRMAIHAAHLMNLEKPGSKIEKHYMQNYVAKYCSALK